MFWQRIFLVHSSGLGRKRARAEVTDEVDGGCDYAYVGRRRLSATVTVKSGTRKNELMHQAYKFNSL